VFVCHTACFYSKVIWGVGKWGFYSKLIWGVGKWGLL